MVIILDFGHSNVEFLLTRTLSFYWNDEIVCCKRETEIEPRRFMFKEICVVSDTCFVVAEYEVCMLPLGRDYSSVHLIHSV